MYWNWKLGDEGERAAPVRLVGTRKVGTRQQKGETPATASKERREEEKRPG
jgi:hypothetical protein